MDYQQIENCDELGYRMITQFIVANPALNQYHFEKVIYTRETIYNGKKYYQVFILVIKNKLTNEKFVLKFSSKLNTNSQSLERYEKDIILKEYNIHHHAFSINPEHTLTIYNHWIFSFNYENNYRHYLVLLLEKGYSLDKLYLNKNIIKRDDYQTFVVRIYLDALQVLIDYKNKALLHRDIKPQNIFLANNKVKIGDFDCSTDNFDKTRYQTSIISSIYAAPEVYPSKIRAKYGSKSQVFSIAVAIAVTLNKGELLGVSKREANRILTNQLDLNEYNLNKASPKFNQLPLLNKKDSLNQILLKGLRYDPLLRVNMNTFSKELENYLDHPNHQNHNSWLWLVLLASLLVITLLLMIL